MILEKASITRLRKIGCLGGWALRMVGTINMCHGAERSIRPAHLVKHRTDEQTGRVRADDGERR